MINKLRQAVHTWYKLSCGCIARQIYNARGNTTDCLWCDCRVFILETVYEKPAGNDDDS